MLEPGRGESGWVGLSGEGGSAALVRSTGGERHSESTLLAEQSRKASWIKRMSKRLVSQLK